ncbi:MAG: zinc-binding dehydrogenase [Ignavibacteriae bacterium]|nr:zinc-binding dehydrogenase [Ignavibacteriota bacterium]
MKAVLLKQTGEIEKLKENLVIDDIPIQEINENEVLVKINYAALNHRDLWITKGLYAGIKLPVVLGSDCSGIIESIGKNVKDFSAGDEVVINPGINFGSDENFQSRDFKIIGLPDNGTLEEYIAIDKSKVYKKPAHLDMIQASALPLAGLTAYRAVFTRGKIEKGKNVLVTGIGGGVSTFALLFATSFCANVYVTSGCDSKLSKALELGAKAGVNYKNENWDKELNSLCGGFNFVIDGTGGETISKCLNVLNQGGKIVNYGATTGIIKNLDTRKIFWKQASILGTTMGSDSDFKNMIDYINDKKITPVVDKVFEMKDAVSAFRRMHKSEQLGKIIISI